jgi:hypothetical protein
MRQLWCATGVVFWGIYLGRGDLIGGKKGVWGYDWRGLRSVYKDGGDVHKIHHSRLRCLLASWFAPLVAVAAPSLPAEG